MNVRVQDEGPAPEPTEPNADSAAPAADEATSPPADDFFANEHAQALADLEREAQGAQAPEAAQPPAEPQAPQEPAPPIMIPKGRFDQEAIARRAAEDQVAYLQGQLAAQQARQPTAAPAQAAPQQPTSPAPTAQDPFEAKIAAGFAQKEALAEQYERGDITFAEHQKLVSAIDREIAVETRRDAISRAAQQQPIDIAAIRDEARVDEAISALEAQSPWVHVVPAEDAAPFMQQAAKIAERQGYAPGTANHRIVQMQVATTLLERVGPDITGFTPEQAHLHAASVARGTYRGAAPNRAGGAPPAAARQSPQPAARGEKLAFAASRMPPDLSATGRPGGESQVTETDIMRMTEDEILALPAATRARILNQ